MYLISNDWEGQQSGNSGGRQGTINLNRKRIRKISHKLLLLGYLSCRYAREQRRSKLRQLLISLLEHDLRQVADHLVVPRANLPDAILQLKNTSRIATRKSVPNGEAATNPIYNHLGQSSSAQQVEVISQQALGSFEVQCVLSRIQGKDGRQNISDSTAIRGVVHRAQLQKCTFWVIYSQQDTSRINPCNGALCGELGKVHANATRQQPRHLVPQLAEILQWGCTRRTEVSSELACSSDGQQSWQADPDT
mmetsp:Transcript_22670/g.51139  ORF Transcript_22670/g.51139 Transcript_22670/m.51139 type:complete len:250 (-) Transcript_22670:8-757(-)